ncbi:MAG: glycosyltransferase [Candidatus Kapabacteria bacterium]|nr:glycosyltransferase [Candidatus Kapabacteria bacterium]MDW8011549.1 glycosyltransferase [Bacteroidota bacterium]
MPSCPLPSKLYTGSTDSTPAVCRQLGAEVCSFPWSDDFSAARNAALEHVRMPWVLALDSDEELETASLLEYAWVLDQPEIGGVEVEIRSIASLQDRQTLIQLHWYPRLFRSGPTIRYIGRVHEQIRPALEARGWQVVRMPIVIWHYGYAGRQACEKARRNAELLRYELARSPGDMWLQYHLGMTLFTAGEKEEALRVLSSCCWSSELSPEQRAWARIRAAQSALALSRLAEVEKLLMMPIPEPALEGLRRFILAATFLQQQRFEQALTLLDSPVVLNSPLVEAERVQGFIRQLYGIVQSLSQQ